MSSAKQWEVLDGGPDAEERTERLVEGAAMIRRQPQRRSILRHERFTLTVAAALMISGAVIVLVGWSGASRTTAVEEQMPYVISGGLLGSALMVVGALTMFSHWLTIGIREARAREAARVSDHTAMLVSQDAILEALREVSAALRAEPAAKRARTTRSRG